jgi:hypothetical protein
LGVAAGKSRTYHEYRALLRFRLGAIDHIAEHVAGDEPHLFSVNRVEPDGGCNDASKADHADTANILAQFQTPSLLVGFAICVWIYRGMDGGGYFYDRSNTRTTPADAEFIFSGNWVVYYSDCLAIFAY